MSGDRWGGPGWLNKLSWLFDASVTIIGFSGKEKCEFFLPAHTRLIIFLGE
jgi:elongator complex protein 4